MKFLMLMVAGFFVSQGAMAKGAISVEQPRAWRVHLFVLNAEMRFERDSNQQILDRRPLNFAGGVSRGNSNYSMEYASFSEKTGNATLSIDRGHQEFSFWWKENLIHFEMAELFLGAGVGAYQEKVTTRLIGNKDVTDSGDLQEMAGLSAGVQRKFAGYILVSLEGRALLGRNMDPNPQGSVVARLGVEF